MTRTVADQMVETLAAAGVERIYGIVGDSLWTCPAVVERDWLNRRPFFRTEPGL
jgi:thiamine pyrophosphate-dependent acetolactate synthase large subunit-like protein